MVGKKKTQKPETLVTPTPIEKQNVPFFDRKISKYVKYIQAEVVVSTISWEERKRCEKCHTIINESLFVQFKDENDDGPYTITFPCVCLECAKRYGIAFVRSEEVPKLAQIAVRDPARIVSPQVICGTCDICQLRDSVHICWYTIPALNNAVKLHFCTSCMKECVPKIPKQLAAKKDWDAYQNATNGFGIIDDKIAELKIYQSDDNVCIKRTCPVCEGDHHVTLTPAGNPTCAKPSTDAEIAARRKAELEWEEQMEDDYCCGKL